MVMRNRHRSSIPLGLAPLPSNPGWGPLGLVGSGQTAPAKKKFPALSGKPAGPIKLSMVEPAASTDVGYVRLLSWPLFNNKTPSYKDMEQSSKLTNCPLGSWLAALAYTANGRKHIQNRLIIETTKQVVEIELSSNANEVPETLKKSGNKIKATRYFTVTIAGKVYRVSSALYTDDADRGWSPVYMGSPTNVLWPCLVEKAYAKHLAKKKDKGDYKLLKDLNDPVIVWKDLVGSTTTPLSVAATPSNRLRSIVRQASTVPTIAASKRNLPANEQDVINWHGYTVLGTTRGGQIRLWDQYVQEELKLSIGKFTRTFDAVLPGAL